MSRNLSSPVAIGATLAALSLVGVLVGAPGAEAGWLDRLARIGGEIGEAGSKAGKAGLGALDDAASLVARLPPPTKGAAALGAHVTPEGHWKFVNRDGDVFTAANADEMRRVAPMLAPDLAADGRLSLYLSEEAAFDGRALLKDLPPDADLHVVAGAKSYRLKRAHDGTDYLVAEIGSNVALELADRALFAEALFQVERPLNKSGIRTLALEPGGPKVLGSVPRFDPVKKTALIDAIDPGALPSALGKVKGQTVMVTGRIDGDRLVFKPSAGGEESLALAELTRAAAASDVNLVVLRSPSPLQPGGRNWLWQTIAVSGLDAALERATFADFLNALGAGSGQLTVSAARDGAGRIVLQALPSGEAGLPLPGVLSDWLGELSGHTVGSLPVHAVTLFARDQERQQELDLRLVPGIPSSVQIAYLVSLVLGLIGWEVSTAWWRRLWPPEVRSEYAGAAGYHAARLARAAAFLLVFAPLVGMPAVLVALAHQVWHWITAPVRLLRWLAAKLSPKAG